MSIFNVFSMLGGLAMFLYGMSVMSESLERKAGSRMKSLLERLSSNPFKGFMLGLGITAVIQSSSAMTVMVVGFVNSGVMQLNQAIGIIMGANVGTTVTSWMLSLTGISGEGFLLSLLKPSNFSPILAVIGIVLFMFSKQNSRKDTGTILLGFALMMFGLETMSAAVAPLADIPQFTNLMLMFSNPILGVLVGTVMTAVIQSSSASVGILQALSLTGTMTYSTAIPIIMGQNIGTCVTALMSSIGASKNAKRAAVVHLYFNVIGTVAFLLLYTAVVAIAKPVFVSSAVSPAGIAIIHTAFNLLSTAVMLPFASVLEKLAYMTVKDGEESTESFELALLDDRIMATPSVAVEQARKVSNMMAEFAFDSCNKAMGLLDRFDKDIFDEVVELEARIDMLEDKLGTYLLALNNTSLSQEDSNAVALLLHSIGDLERVGDHALGLAKTAEEIYTKSITFSSPALKDIGVMRAAIGEIMNITVNSFTQQNRELAHKVEPLEQVVNVLRIDMKSNHIERLRTGDCTMATGFVFSDLLTNFERISDHCSNLAVGLIRAEYARLDAHEYLSDVKSGNNAEYTRMFNEYSKKYAL